MSVVPAEREWAFAGERLAARRIPRVFGIINVTPDSFSDGGQFLDPARGVDRALQLAADGAEILDIGGESTRPGSTPVPEADEIRRVVPVIERLAAQTSALISIDTSKSAVAREALAAGAVIVNDISGLTFDPGMVDLCAESDCGIVVMHIQGTPQTMQIDPRYENVVEEVAELLEHRVAFLAGRGISADRVLVDPGIGFGKTPKHNVDLLTGLRRFQRTGRPVLIGHSRKRFIAKIVGHPLDERDSGTVGISIAAAQLGADYLRVHDVRQTCDALMAWSAVVNGSPFQ